MTNDIWLPSEWTEESYREFQTSLKQLSDEDYKKFNARLIPGTPLAYGIRIPTVRKIACAILQTDYLAYLQLPKSSYHEEVILEGLVMAGIPCSYPEMLQYMKSFSLKIYNWAINDTVVFKGIKKYTDQFITDADDFVFHENPWVQRFGYLHLMNFCLTEAHIDAVLNKVDAVNSDFYYVQMMQAWLLATAIAKQRDQTIAYLTGTNHLNETTFKMTVRKARESFRVSSEDKALLKSIL